MKKNDVLTQMAESIEYFINHIDNQPDTEFCKNVDKLIYLRAYYLVNGVEKSEANLNIADVSGRLPTKKDIIDIIQFSETKILKINKCVLYDYNYDFVAERIIKLII